MLDDIILIDELYSIICQYLVPIHVIYLSQCSKKFKQYITGPEKYLYWTVELIKLQYNNKKVFTDYDTSLSKQQLLLYEKYRVSNFNDLKKHISDYLIDYYEYSLSITTLMNNKFSHKYRLSLDTSYIDDYKTWKEKKTQLNIREAHNFSVYFTHDDKINDKIVFLYHEEEYNNEGLFYLVIMLNDYMELDINNLSFNIVFHRFNYVNNYNDLLEYKNVNRIKLVNEENQLWSMCIDNSIVLYFTIEKYAGLDYECNKVLKYKFMKPKIEIKKSKFIEWISYCENYSS